MINIKQKRLYSCPHCSSKRFQKRGYYYKKITKTYLPKYKCNTCFKVFSTSTVSKIYKQKRPDLNTHIYHQYTSGVTLRRIAQNLSCNYKTVYKKFLFISEWAQTLVQGDSFTVKELYIDESESIEHTKLKPVTIALAVSDDYKILGVKVGRIPAKGHIAEISVKKYGYRENESDKCVNELLADLKIKNTDFTIKSDAKPGYAQAVKKAFPKNKHETFVAEENKEKKKEYKYTNLEKRVFDPLFIINQRAAKFRDHIKRMTRKSWCTSKIVANLERNIYIYIARNNGYVFT